MRSDTPKILSLRPADGAPVREIFNRDAISTPERDSFVAETAVKIEQLEAAARGLARTVADLVTRVDAVQEIAGNDHRLHAFDQQDRRSREGKLDEMVRSLRDLKAQLDRTEARSGGDYHAYNSFEAVSRKLAELKTRTRAGTGFALFSLAGCLPWLLPLDSVFTSRADSSEPLIAELGRGPI